MRKLIVDVVNTPYLSHISLFEIAIKQKIGKLATLTIPVPKLMELAISHGFAILPITATHIAAYDRIPLMADHRDPFDRLLLATALAEDMPVLSSDGHFFSAVCAAGFHNCRITRRDVTSSPVEVCAADLGALQNVAKLRGRFL